MKVTRIFWDLLELMTGFVFILLRVHQQKYTVSRRAHLVFSAHLPISNQLFECFDIEPAEFFYATEIKQSRIIKILNNNYFHNLYYIIHPPARQKWAAVWMEEYVQACYYGQEGKAPLSLMWLKYLGPIQQQMLRVLVQHRREGISEMHF